MKPQHSGAASSLNTSKIIRKPRVGNLVCVEKSDRKKLHDDQVNMQAKLVAAEMLYVIPERLKHWDAKQNMPASFTVNAYLIDEYLNNILPQVQRLTHDFFYDVEATTPLSKKGHFKFQRQLILLKKSQSKAKYFSRLLGYNRVIALLIFEAATWNLLWAELF